MSKPRAFNANLLQAWRTTRLSLPGWIVRHRILIGTVAWMGMSAVAFGISAFLTHRIAFVTHVLDADAHPGTILAEASGWYVFNVFAVPGTTGAAEVNYDFASSEEGDAVLSFRPPPGSEKLRIWNLYSPNGCHYMGGTTAPGYFPGKPLPDSRLAGNNAVVDLRGLTFDREHRIDCDVRPSSMAETFTTTVSAFGNMANLAVTSDSGSKLEAIPVKLTFNGRPGTFEFITSPAFSEGGTLIEANQYSIVRFRSIRQEQRRDWYLILIGAFVGFGAALMVEAFRPLIERIGEVGGPPPDTK